MTGPQSGDHPFVFVNYRTDDDPSMATLLDTALSARFGQDSVFLDYRSIPPGEDFVAALLAAVRRAAVLLVVVGRDWLRPTARGRPALHDPDDWVRREILEAFAARIPVVPVLVGDRPQLRADELPAELRALARRQFVRIRHRHQHQDIQHLVGTLPVGFPPAATETVRDAPPQFDLSGAKGVQIGNDNVQHNQFS